MSDLASQRALTRTPTHLPLSWYFDPRVAEIENRILFDRGPGYVGHAMMAPQPRDYRVLDWRESGPGWVLVNNGGRHDMVSNVCRHRQAVMLQGAGQLPGGTITCPVHRWSYDASGRHIGAPPALKAGQKPTGKSQPNSQRHQPYERSIKYKRALAPVRIAGDGRLAA